MRPIDRKSKLFVLCLFGLWLSLAVRQAAQGPAMSVTPANPTISVGQTQQFTASGAVTPTAVSAGGEYTCVRLPDGTVQCVGRNQFGQLANGTIDNSSVLGPVSDLSTVTRLWAADEFGCAMLADGTARCWGLGESGQRGDGTFTTFSSQGERPVVVSGLGGGVDISGGYAHACALLADGTMRCWGRNVDGQLGDPSAQPGSAVPVAVSGLTSAAAMTAGAFHTCALLTDGTLRCWGLNAQGQVGDGTRENAFTPVPVAGITGVAAVSAGGVHTCAVLRDGTVQCWGENEFGQLGDGTTMTSTTPVPVAGITGAVAVSAGWRHACALLGDGTVRCWGQNEFGQLGNGTTTDSTSPVPVVGITGAVAVTAGWFHHSCALLGGGTVRCWGVNEWGQFGNGTATSSTTPVTMTGTGLTWTSSNTAVATIDATGRAMGVSSGTTTITATDASGASASTTLTVQAPVTLSVVRAGAGTGSVSSSPPGISCGTDCSEPYNTGTSVTLTATAASGSTFGSWIGCDTVSGPTCTVTMTAARTVTASFDLQRFILTVNKTGLLSDLGSVSSSPSGIDCGADCYEPYTIGTVVILRATPGILLAGWNGCDTVSGAICAVMMGSAKSVTARFVDLP